MAIVIIDEKFLVENNPYKNQDIGEHDLVADFANIIKWNLELNRFHQTVSHNRNNKILHSSILSKNCPMVLPECPLGFDNDELSNSLDIMYATSQRTCYILTFKKPNIIYSFDDLKKEMFGISKNGKINEGAYVYRLMARGFRNIEFHVFAQIDHTCFNSLFAIKKQSTKDLEKYIIINYCGSKSRYGIEPRLDSFKLIIHDDLKKIVSSKLSKTYSYYEIDGSDTKISHPFFRYYNSMHSLKEILFV